MTLKQQFDAAKARLGEEKATSIIASLKGPRTIKQQVDALEVAVEAEVHTKRAATQRQVSAAEALKIEARLRRSSPSKKAPAETARDLCNQYDALDTEVDRRKFWRDNESALTDPDAQISGLVTICMAAAKPLSWRARAGLHFRAKNEPERIKMTK